VKFLTKDHLFHPLKLNWKQEKTTIGALAVGVSLNLFVMGRIKIQNLLPRNLVLPKLKQLGYALAKRQITLPFVTALIASCKILITPLFKKIVP
jgi:hypothetical protein